MTKYFCSDFEEASFKERMFFKRMIEKYNLFNEDKWFHYLTDYTSYAVYDAMARNKETNQRLIIEIKIRDTTYGEYVYETKKHRDLTKVKNEEPDVSRIIYINSTPEGTYIWDIDKVIKNYKPIKMLMNKATKKSRKDKEYKNVYLLGRDSAKKIDFKWDEKWFREWCDEQDKKFAPKKPKEIGIPLEWFTDTDTDKK